MFIVHWCGRLPSCCCWSRRGFPARIFFKLLNLLSRINRRLHSFSFRISSIIVTSTQRLLNRIIPVFRTNGCVNSKIIRFSAVVIAVTGSPRLLEFKPVVCAFFGVFARDCYFLLACPPFYFVMLSRLSCQSV